MDLILITIKLIYKIEQGTWNSVLFYAEGNRVLSFFVSWEQRKLNEVISEYKETVDSGCDLPILTSSKSEGVVCTRRTFW